MQCCSREVIIPLVALVAVSGLWLAVLQAGDPPVEQPAPAAATGATQPAEAQPAEKPAADKPASPLAKDGRVRLSQKFDVWMDPKQKEVFIPGRVCLREGQLEMLVTLEGKKTHESVVEAFTNAYVIHAALLALGAEQGEPASFLPKFKPVTGSQIDVYFQWQDENGKTLEVRGQDWVRYSLTQQALDEPFLFGGSRIQRDPNTGRQFYEAEDGDFICVSNFPSAMLDLPVESSQDASALVFEAFAERIPPLGTPVTIVLRPKVKQDN